MLSCAAVNDDPARSAPPLPPLPPVDPARAAGGADITPEAFAGFLTDGDVEVARWALVRALERRSRAEVYDTFVREAMRLVGERWISGRWTISEEHLASRTLGKVLAAVAPVPSPAGRIGPLAVLAGVAGEEHSIGLLALTHVLMEAGFEVADLGADVPAEDLVRYVAKTQARLVAVTASTAAHEETLRATVAAVRALPAPPAIVVGGRIATVADLTDTGADWIGSSLVDLDRWARATAARLASEADAS